MPKKQNTLNIINASEHNLKNIDVSIPHHSLTVITGVSGSGKSSLAYSVIYKESQRRFLESFSSRSRQYIGKLEKPKVKEISGLQAALAINQKTVVANPRSTVGTMSGVYDYLRLLYARLGEVVCSKCYTKLDKGSKTCSSCQTSQTELLAKLFSFNSKYGACPTCNGLGLTEQIDPEKLVANPLISITDGALVPTTPTGYIVYSQVRVDELNKVCNAHGFSVDIPWNELTKEQQDIIWYGSDKVKILFGKHSLESRLKWKGITAKPREEAFYKGMIPIMEEILKRDRNDNILRFASSFVCHDCKGDRIKTEARNVFINGKNISQLCQLSISDLSKHLKTIGKTIKEKHVFEHILNPINKRIEYLKLLGLNYLTLGRESTTLSGGEAQRIRLASQVGSGLQGILYILDEPSIGLHNRDNQKLLRVLKSLRDNGNTVLVVEHDEETIKAADFLIDIGPKAGLNGGEVLYQGNAENFFKNKHKYPLSKTAQTISVHTEEKIKLDYRYETGFIQINGASKHNLKEINVAFKLAAFNVVTGVSGAGKSTLVHHVLGKYLRGKNETDYYKSIELSQDISRVIEISQSPIGRTPRSNPATYTDLFDHIRDLFGMLPEAKEKGYKKGSFSFNNKGGRCEKCQGAGSIQLGMHFLGNVNTVCEYCNGKRFIGDILEIKYKGKSIADVLELSISEARTFFEEEHKIIKILDQLIKLDVGYLKLGQPSTTLSGGEAQRIKLASELYKTSKGHSVYILDEPTMGLHKADIQHLLVALNEIVDNGHTVIVIEHDTDIIKQADWIIDLGPEGGEDGGHLVFQGRPADIISSKRSFTSQALNKLNTPTAIRKTETIEASKPTNIYFNGITTNNLKNINIEIPINKTTVITGVSGSGKSSLAFDTIYAESRNRFTESFSSYARRMMSKIKKAELEQCSGLTPAIAIKQSKFKKNPRSTVGTITEIYDYYRLLFSRLGVSKNGIPTNLPASMFSFNKLEAACSSCKGLGSITSADPEKFISHPEKPIIDGAMNGSIPGKFFGDVHGQYIHTLLQVGKELSLDFSIPYNELSEDAKDVILYGTAITEYHVEWNFKRGNRTGSHQLQTVWKGFIQLFNEEYELRKNGKRGESYALILSDKCCNSCKGERLNEAILDVQFHQQNISQLSSLAISKSLQYFKTQENHLNEKHNKKALQIISQLIAKLDTLENIGLGYLSIDRQTSSLSGGEAQRLRIASQLVSNLCGLTYVLDEPTIGLHSRDTKNLMKAIKKLQDNSNTVVIVEHDPEVISMADYIIDMGPGAGEYGGEIIAQGSLMEIIENKESITGKYLSLSQITNRSTVSQVDSRLHTVPNSKQLTDLKSKIEIKGASANNLKNIDLQVPIGMMTSITGVSGSGKTSLAFDVIADSFKASTTINCDDISFCNIKNISVIDQQGIGTSPLSTSATYTGLFDLIRELFAKLDESKKRGLKKSHFSFNSKEGRCEVCSGMGQLKVPMDFLSDVWTSCDSCHGKRYKESILDILYQGHSINDVLNLSVIKAISVFENEPKIKILLNVLEEIGLGYIKLGQATSTLSGGEIQRLKLASELIKESTSNTLYIFDEPSTGLHLKDVERLINVFGKLVSQGNTILVVEHHLDIIRASDWIVDLGPEGGENGGKVLYSGIASGLKDCTKSITADYI